jgi:hypothetical protein
VNLAADLTAAEWLALGIGLGTLAATVTALVWKVFGRPPDRKG